MFMNTHTQLGLIFRALQNIWWTDLDFMHLCDYYCLCEYFVLQYFCTRFMLSSMFQYVISCYQMVTLQDQHTRNCQLDWWSNRNSFIGIVIFLVFLGSNFFFSRFWSDVSLREVLFSQYMKMGYPLLFCVIPCNYGSRKRLVLFWTS